MHPGFLDWPKQQLPNRRRQRPGRITSMPVFAVTATRRFSKARGASLRQRLLNWQERHQLLESHTRSQALIYPAWRRRLQPTCAVRLSVIAVRSLPDVGCILQNDWRPMPNLFWPCRDWRGAPMLSAEPTTASGGALCRW